MSSGFDLAVVGALLQLCNLSTSLLVCLCSALCCMLLCSTRQRLNLVNPAASMRLRSKRTCSGVECFGGFHIKRFFHLFWFSREDFTGFSNIFLFLRGDLT